MKYIIASDKSGFYLKEFIKTNLIEKGYDVVDMGTTDVEQPQPFVAVAPKVAPKIASKEYDKAILICGTGMGMSQVANKYKGVLAACCESVYAARMSRVINNSNILCMGGWVIGPEMGLEMSLAFLNTEHTEGLEEWRAEFLKKAYDEVSNFDYE